jgi:hypothetical protein
MNVFLALSLIMVFYILFNINDNHDNKNAKNLIENFQGSSEDTKKIEQDIGKYFQKRIKRSMFNNSLYSLKRHINKNTPDKDRFVAPIVVNKNVETNETKIYSDSPIYNPTNLYVNGAFVINNKGSGLAKNLCMGDNCYSEQDILYIIQDLLPYYNYTSSRDSNQDISELCFEDYRTLSSMTMLIHLEAPTIREGLDYYNQLLALKEFVKDYDFDTNDNTIDKNLIIANSLKTDYYVISFIKKYPQLLDFFKKNFTDNFSNLNKLANDTSRKYYQYRHSIYKNIKLINKKNCINGDDLKILKGQRPIKLTTRDSRIRDKTILNGAERWHTNYIDSLREYYTHTGKGKRTYLGQANTQMYNDKDIYYKNSIIGDNLTSKPYLNEQHFEVHGINDDDDDCMGYKKMKIATMSKSKRGDERRRNGQFSVEKVSGKGGETGVFCKPEE